MLPPEGCGPLRGSSSSEKQKPGLKSGQAVNNRVLWCEKGEPYKLHFCTFSEVVNNGPNIVQNVFLLLETCKWAGHENADFRATDSGSFVSSVVLRIVGQSVARAALGD